MKINFAKGGGLVPAIIQNADTEQVLMLGYMNADALSATRDSGLVTFFSRSRNCLWQKGETSGNKLVLVDIKVDCDQDTLLVRARPAGPTCHEGTISCFGNEGSCFGNEGSCFGNEGPHGLGWLAQLSDLIENRKTSDPKTSYTASLLQGGLTKCAQKLGEESVETVIAALCETDEQFKAEAADLLYHLMVLLAAKNMSLKEVIATLKNRAA